MTAWEQCSPAPGGTPIQTAARQEHLVYNGKPCEPLGNLT